MAIVERGRGNRVKRLEERVMRDTVSRCHLAQAIFCCCLTADELIAEINKANSDDSDDPPLGSDLVYWLMTLPELILETVHREAQINFSRERLLEVLTTLGYAPPEDILPQFATP